MWRAVLDLVLKQGDDGGGGGGGGGAERREMDEDLAEDWWSELTDELTG